MKIKILSRKPNALLKRNEVVFDVDHSSEGRTPSRAELRDNLSKVLKSDRSLIFVRKAVTKTGQQSAIGYANLYETPEQALLVESKHIIARNSPSESSKVTKADALDRKDQEEPPKKDDLPLTKQTTAKGEDEARPAKSFEAAKDSSEPKDEIKPQEADKP